MPGLGPVDAGPRSAGIRGRSQRTGQALASELGTDHLDPIPDEPDLAWFFMPVTITLLSRANAAALQSAHRSPGDESRVYRSADWVKCVLDLPMVEPPGTRGRYCSGNVLVAGRIVASATGKPLLAFAQENLFTPLGIRARDVRWDFTLTSSNAATFAQLYLRPRDMLKLGVLYHQKGSWGGRQVISREWVARSTARWSTVGDQEYGYFWWHQRVDASSPGGPRRVDMVVATGKGGQKIYLVPSLDLVVVLTGGRYNSQSPASSIMAQELLPALLSQTGTSRK